jgi:hypothetical protein
MLQVGLAGGNKVLRHWRWLRLRPALIFNLIDDASSLEETIRRDLKFVWCLWAARGSCLCLPLFLNVSWYLSQSVPPGQELRTKMPTFPRRFFSLLYWQTYSSSTYCQPGCKWKVTREIHTYASGAWRLSYKELHSQ